MIQHASHGRNYGEEHEQALKRVLRYLSGTRTMGVVYKKSEEVSKQMSLTVYSDSDFAGQHVHHGYSTAGVLILNQFNHVLHWVSRKQKAVSVSSCEAEYQALAEACKLVRLYRYILTELKMLKAGATEIFVDNKSAIQVALGARTTEASRHVAVRHHLVREMIEEGEVPKSRKQTFSRKRWEEKVSDGS